jgi:hypothetical protein
MAKEILDKKQLGNGYEFIPTPVWYSVTVDVPEGTMEAVRKLTTNFYAVQTWLDSLYETARQGIESTTMPDEIKEILWPTTVQVPAEQASAKQQKKRATAAASNTPSPKA